jgi:recombinational DNA repair ATPase RecF
MHLQRLKIKDFRNLKDFEIVFTESIAENDGEKREFKSHAIIGQNGAGKSNLMEAIITLFRDLDLNNAASLDYELDYTIRSHRIEISAEHGKKPAVTIDGERSTATTLAEHAREYLPSHVFTYYSGKNARIERLFQAHQKRFTQALRKNQDDLIRRLFYCRGGHSQLVLLVFGS